MAKYQYQYDKSGRPQVPWHFPWTLASFGGDQAAMEQYLDQQCDEWYRISAKLIPGEPHPLAYEDQEDDHAYKRNREIWQAEMAQERVMSRHREAVQQAAEAERRRNQPLPTTAEGHATILGSGADAARAKQVLAWETAIAEQTKSAQEQRLHGRESKARDCEQRIVSYHREIDKLRNGYEFQEQMRRDVVEHASDFLSSALKWSPEQLAEESDRVRKELEAFRSFSDAQHSYVLTGEGESLRLSKVNHPDIAARDLAARVGDISDENLLLKLSCHGVESRPEPGEETSVEGPAEGEDEGEAAGESQQSGPDYNSAKTQREFEEMREAAGAKPY